MTSAVVSPNYKCIRVTWVVEIQNTKTNALYTTPITTYYRPKIEKEDAALEAVRYHLGKNEKISLIISKDKQPIE